MKLQHGLKSLMLALIVTAIVAVIAAPFIQPILDDYELVGVQITPVGWVALILFEYNERQNRPIKGMVATR